MTGRYGTLGEVFYIEQDYWPHNTALYVCNFKGNYPRYIAYLLKTIGLGIQNSAGAAPGVNRNFLHQLPIVIATNKDIQRRIASIQTQFINAIDPIDLMVLNLRNQNRKLAEARDLLLPRLMSGEVEV